MSPKIIATPHLIAPSTPPPRRGLPTWVLVLGGAAVALFLLTVAAPFFIPWDKVRVEAMEAASQALGREVGIDSIEVSLWKGVHLRNLHLANAKGGFSDQALFTNADAKVSVNFLSLLGGRLVINSVTFLKPQLLLETNAQGVSNLKGLGGSGAAPSAPKTASAPAATAQVSGKTFPAVVGALVIEDGDVIVRDRRKGTETAVHGLNLKLTGISLAAAGASRLEAHLIAEVEGKKIPLSLVSDFSVDLDQGSVELRSCTLQAPALLADLTGTVKDFAHPQVRLHLAAAVQLEKLPDLLPPSLLAQLPPDVKTKGALKLDLDAAGAVDHPQDLDVKGGLDLEDVTAEVGAYPALGDLKGRVEFDRAGVDLPALTFKLGGDPVTFAFSAHWGDLSHLTGPLDRLQAAVTYRVSSPKLNLDPLLAVGATTTAASLQPPTQASSPAAGALPSYARSVPPGLSVDGRVAVDSMVVRGYTTGAFTHHLVLRRQQLTSSSRLALYGGSLSEDSRADFSRPGPPFRSDLGVHDLQFRHLVDDAMAAAPGSPLARLKGKVDGSLTVVAKVQGRGFSKPWVLDNTQAQVDFTFSRGVVRALDLQEKLAAVIPDPQTQALLRSDITFAKAQGQVTYAQRRVTLKQFNLGSGADWRQGPEFVQASGTLDLGKGLDFKIIPHFNPSVDRIAGDVGRAFQDDRGWPTFDYIEYSGPTPDQAKADFSAGLAKAARQALRQHLDQVKQVVQQKASGLLKQLPGGLNKLFGP